MISPSSPRPRSFQRSLERAISFPSLSLSLSLSLLLSLSLSLFLSLSFSLSLFLSLSPTTHSPPLGLQVFIVRGTLLAVAKRDGCDQLFKVDRDLVPEVHWDSATKVAVQELVVRPVFGRKGLVFCPHLVRFGVSNGDLKVAIPLNIAHRVLLLVPDELFDRVHLLLLIDRGLVPPVRDAVHERLYLMLLVQSIGHEVGHNISLVSKEPVAL